MVSPQTQGLVIEHAHWDPRIAGVNTYSLSIPETKSETLHMGIDSRRPIERLVCTYA